MADLQDSWKSIFKDYGGKFSGGKRASEKFDLFIQIRRKD